MSFNLIPDEYELPPVRLTLKTRESGSNNPKAPTLRGFLAVNLQSLKDIEEHIKASGNDAVFLDVALWPARDGRYVHEGAVELRGVQASEPPPDVLSQSVEQLTTHFDGLPW
jgi:hypothetical protein